MTLTPSIMSSELAKKMSTTLHSPVITIGGICENARKKKLIKIRNDCQNLRRIFESKRFIKIFIIYFSTRRATIISVPVNEFSIKMSILE